MLENKQLSVDFSPRDLRQLVIPLVIEQLLAITVGLSDSLMVAQVGEAAMSAVSLVDTVNVLLVNAFAALATGGAVIVGQYLGRREPEKAGHSGQQLLLFMGEVSLLVTVCFYLGKGFILGVVFGQVEPDVAAYANTYFLIVFFTEQSHCTQLLGFLNGHFPDGDVHGLVDLVVHDLLHAGQFLGSDSAEVGKVEVRDLCILIGACLMHMVAQHFTQRCLQQMGGSVVAGNGHAVFLVHLSVQMVAHLHDAALQHAGVDVVALGGLFHVQHTQAALGAGQQAVVRHLTTHLSVERGLVQNHQHAVLCLLVGGNGIGQGLLVAQSNDSAVVAQGVVAGEDGGLGLQCAEQVFAPAGDVLLQALRTGTLLLLGHFGVEAFLVDLNALLRSDLLGQIQWEAEGIIQLEHVLSLIHI